MLKIKFTILLGKLHFLPPILTLIEGVPSWQKTLQRSAILMFLIGLLLSTLVQAQQNADLNFTPQERQWMLDNQQVSVAYEGYFPPYSFLNDEQQVEGLAVDVFA